MGSYHNSIQLLLDAKSGRRVQDENSLTFMNNPNLSPLHRLKFRSSTSTLAAGSNQKSTTVPPEESAKLSQIHTQCDYALTLIQMHALCVYTLTLKTMSIRIRIRGQKTCTTAKNFSFRL